MGCPRIHAAEKHLAQTLTEKGCKVDTRKDRPASPALRKADVQERTVRLPVPVTTHWDWQLHGSCRNHACDPFFAEDPSSEALAKQICSGCPVLQTCRQHAIICNEPYGIWGGLKPEERSKRRWEYTAHNVRARAKNRKFG
ncbi:WhiB family transcriptional regulator [Rhodococcus sp. SORGH_AS_0301]|uniref:WhiB family transcriptional regulator n=1 Tax=Rhodococcus sp. SORGH_AS_0301 TaxID=3041780 RepID=UPI0027D79980|nr:WhiB family transcriptional regulator [Rhodococcus sp. SORGH_AS_0301]